MKIAYQEKVKQEYMQIIVPSLFFTLLYVTAQKCGDTQNGQSFILEACIGKKSFFLRIQSSLGHNCQIKLHFMVYWYIPSPYRNKFSNNQNTYEYPFRTSFPRRECFDAWKE